MPDVRINITAQDLASGPIDQVEAKLRELQSTVASIRADMVRQYGEFAGGRAFTKGADEGLRELRQTIRETAQALGDLKAQAQLGNLGLATQLVPPNATRDLSSLEQSFRQVSRARDSLFATPSGDLGVLAMLDNEARLAKAKAERTAEEKHQYDQETQAMAALAKRQGQSYDDMIKNLKKYNTEEEKAYRDRQRFQSQVAPQASVAAQQRLLQDQFDNETAAMQRAADRQKATYAQMAQAGEKYVAARKQQQKEAEAFASQIAPQLSVSYGYDKVTGQVKAFSAAARESGEVVEQSMFRAEGGIRHLVAIFDEFMRGQRGQMSASAIAFVRDTGLYKVALSALTSGWGLFAAAGVAALAAVGYELEQAYQRWSAIREAQGVLATQGFGSPDVTRADVSAYFDKNAAATREWAGTEKAAEAPLYELSTALRTIKQDLEDYGKAQATLRHEDLGKEMEKIAKAGEHGAVGLAELITKENQLQGVFMANHQTLVGYVKSFTGAEDQAKALAKGINELLGPMIKSGDEARRTGNDLLGTTAAMIAYGNSMGMVGQESSDAAKAIEKQINPTDHLNLSATQLTETFRQQNEALEAGDRVLDERAAKLNQLALAQAGLNREMAGTGRPVEGTMGRRTDTQYDAEAIKRDQERLKNLQAEAHKGALSPGEEYGFEQQRLQIETRARERPEDIDAQIKAKQDELDLEKQIVQTRMGGKASEAEVAGDPNVMRAQLALNEEIQKKQQQAAQDYIAGQQAIIAEAHRGSQERLDAEDRIIAKIREEVAAGIASQSQLNQALRERGNLQRQIENEEFDAFRDAGRAQIEEARDNAGKIDEIYRGIWQKAIDTGQTKQVFEEITREWVRDIKTARQQTFQEFSAGEREKIQEAQGDWAKILQIYQEWADKAKAMFGTVSKEFKEVQKDMVKAAQDGIKQIINEDEKYADEQVKVLNDQMRLNELQREAVNVTGGTESHQKAIAGYQQELAEAQATAAQEMQLYDEVAHEQGATAQQKLTALEKEEEVGMQAAEKEMELAKKIAEEQKKAAEEATKAWTEFFKKEGDDLTNYMENILERKPNALKDFIDSTRKNLMKLGENLLSETLGKAMGVDVKPGSGLGGLFEGIFDKIFGISSKDPSKETVNAIRIGNDTARKSQGVLEEIRNILKQQHADAQAARDKLQQTVSGGSSTPSSGVGIGKMPSGTMLSLGEMKGFAEQAGFSPEDASTMAAIAMAESKGDPYAKGSAGEIGITQILPGTTGAHQYASEAMGDPLRAMQLARQIQQTEGWGAWSTYKHGDYQKYLSAAQNVEPKEMEGGVTGEASGQAQAALSYALTRSGEKLKDYCATLVNQSLEKAGVKGSGSGLASSFAPGAGYGTPISADQVRAGDIFYKGPSGAGDTGHVGFTMGPVQANTVQVMSSHISGDPSNPAGVETRSTSGMSFIRPEYTDTKDVNLSQIGGANIASPNDPGAVPTSATQQAGLSQVSITASVPIDVNVKSMPPSSAAGGGKGTGMDAPAISAQGGFIPYPTSMPSDVKAAIRAHGLGGIGRRAYGPGVNDNQGGMLAVVHPGEMIVPADVISQMPSSQGGAYDEFGGESRGFQSVTTVQAHPGIGKGLASLLMILGGVGAIAGVSALFGGKKSTDQTQTQDMLKDPNFSVLADQAAVSGAGGGQTNLSPLMTSGSSNPTTASGTSGQSGGNSSANLASTASQLTNSLSSLNTAATGSSQALSPFSQGLNEAKSGLSIFTSALSAVKGIGGLFSGGGGLLSIFGLSNGGVIPSAAGGMIVPRFQGGGILSMLHMNEMVLPSHISQFVQNAAANGNASANPTHVANFNISAIDARSGADFLMRNSDTIARAYARSHRAYSTNVPRT